MKTLIIMNIKLKVRISQIHHSLYTKPPNKVNNMIVYNKN